ncbi:phosphate:Na+ symporter [Rubritalea squalenifaciens DSM 18772]|uniref:Phosphate:Na+ symporter n=1 Tax=Rubritalea squalenifaciens DSM 18772 TaxID=1123071 RepID=A0A1M6LGM7_9BACT|nr:Na/Pi cotransporter family protein [Rubritalea squalenifaciens]SHJ70352.1 phosphate:Na+ symporter [Rubritalea squalenifaciens DSM 18772]
MIWSTITSILGILGALGIFLFGMKVMSEGIQKVAGDSMRKALATMTKNRFSAAFTGFFTTCMVQSSSATTVLVVSFVNAGLLTLVESIGVIMGANLGTTITAWLVAFIPKFSVSKIALPVIGIGLPMFFIGKNKGRALGETLIGFGLLFFGLSQLKNAVPDVDNLMATNAQLAEFIQNAVSSIQSFSFGSTVIFLILGIILTVVVQSSSAAMAITIAFAWNGWLGDDPQQAFMSCAAIVLGENIGTTITAWLASIGANVHAKRAARAHFMFNVIGTIWAVILFGLFTKFVWNILGIFPDWMVEMKTKKAGADVNEQLIIVAFAVAIFHTTFNFVNILLLIPFVKQISNVVVKMVPDKDIPEEDRRIRYISQTLIDLGELNIVEAEKAVERLSTQCQEMFKGYIEVFENPHQDMSAQVNKLKEMEDEADEMMQDLTEYLVRCTSKEASPHLSERIAALLRITAELEECSDAIYRLIKIAERKYKKGRQFTPDQVESIMKIANVIEEFMQFTHARLLVGLSDEDSAQAQALRDKVVSLRKKYNKVAMARMAEGNVKVEMLNIDTNTQLDVVSNHLFHVAQTNAELA